MLWPGAVLSAIFAQTSVAKSREFDDACLCTPQGRFSGVRNKVVQMSAGASESALIWTNLLLTPS